MRMLRGRTCCGRRLREPDLHVAAPRPAPITWLEGKSITVILGLVYGYIPYMILPLFGFLDRIESSLLEAGRDLGASPVRTFWRVTLPLSKPAILRRAGDRRRCRCSATTTPTTCCRASPKTSMFGNLIDDAIGQRGQGPRRPVLVLLLMVLLIVPMLYYLRSTLRAQEAAMSDDARPRDAPPGRPRSARRPTSAGSSNPWRKPRFLRRSRVGYLAWSILPVLIAIAVLLQRRAVEQHAAGLLAPVVVQRPRSTRRCSQDPALDARDLPDAAAVVR